MFEIDGELVEEALRKLQPDMDLAMQLFEERPAEQIEEDADFAFGMCMLCSSEAGQEIIADYYKKLETPEMLNVARVKEVGECLKTAKEIFYKCRVRLIWTDRDGRPSGTAFIIACGEQVFATDFYALQEIMSKADGYNVSVSDLEDIRFEIVFGNMMIPLEKNEEA